MRDKVTRECPQTTTLEEEGELREEISLTSCAHQHCTLTAEPNRLIQHKAMNPIFMWSFKSGWAYVFVAWERMCVCVCVCVCVCKRAHVNVCVCVHPYLCVYVFVAWERESVCVCVHPYLCILKTELLPCCRNWPTSSVSRAWAWKTFWRATSPSAQWPTNDASRQKKWGNFCERAERLTLPGPPKVTVALALFRHTLWVPQSVPCPTLSALDSECLSRAWTDIDVISEVSLQV